MFELKKNKIDIYFDIITKAVDDFAYRIRTNKLEIAQVLDLLISKNLVRSLKNVYSGTSYRLTKLGRDVVLELNKFLEQEKEFNRVFTFFLHKFLIISLRGL